VHGFLVSTHGPWDSGTICLRASDCATNCYQLLRLLDYIFFELGFFSRDGRTQGDLLSGL
jgi:hypothetical protein